MTPEELQELCALYALHALDPDEAAIIEERLRVGDPEVMEELAAFRDVVQLLPYALPLQTPPPRVRAQLLQRIQASQPAAPFREMGTPPRVVPLRRRWQPWLAAAAALVVVSFSGWTVATLRTQVLTLEEKNNQLQQLVTERQQRLQSLEAQVQQFQHTTGQYQTLWTFLSSPAVKIVLLTGSEHAPAAGARLLWDTQRGAWTVVTYALPALPPGKTYQLWFLGSGQPIPSGTFHPTADGRGLIQATLPADRTDIAGAAVSIEPEGGVLQPTGNIVLVGKL